MMISTRTFWFSLMAAMVVSSCSGIDPPSETWSTKANQPYNDVVRLISIQAEKCWTRRRGLSRDPVVVETRESGAYFEVTARRDPRDITLEPFIRVQIARAGGPTRVTVLEGDYTESVLGLTQHVKDWMEGRRACREFQT